VTIGNGNAISKYCKALPLPIVLRNAIADKIETRRYSYGIGIAGNLAAATSFFTILSGTLQSLFVHGATPPPTSEEIISFANKIANAVVDDVRPQGDFGHFGALIFGFEMDNAAPFTFAIEPKLQDNGMYSMHATKYQIYDTFVAARGSGGPAFLSLLAEQKDP